ncbi:MAG TPA: Hsp20/alpha crystallin family protein [Armatimonadota bacterium]|nr:Hsp20/alpha crystallin family protein [Armatimonadota bacterium]
MSIGDWDVFGDMARLRRGLDRFSEGLWPGREASEGEAVWAPPVDVYEEDGGLVLVVDLPGVRREGIDLRIDDASVTLEGERGRTESSSGVRLERPVGRFRRAFRIGIPVDPSGARATYREGVLRITIPRAAPGGRARVRVEVE